ncbi:hypothetical protein [Streptomyces sp. NPDC015414]
MDDHLVLEVTGTSSGAIVETFGSEGGGREGDRREAKACVGRAQVLTHTA